MMLAPCYKYKTWYSFIRVSLYLFVTFRAHGVITQSFISDVVNECFLSFFSAIMGHYVVVQCPKTEKMTSLAPAPIWFYSVTVSSDTNECVQLFCCSLEADHGQAFDCAWNM